MMKLKKIYVMWISLSLQLTSISTKTYFEPIYVNHELPFKGGKTIATFDMNKENVVAQVQKLSDAVLYRNFGTFQATDEWPFRGGKAKATIDTSKTNVVKELNKLNDASRDSGEPFLTVEFPVIGCRKLNMNKLETRKKLKEIAEEYEEYFEPLYVTYELPFSGGRAIAATFDTSKMNVLEDLQKLNETVSNASYVKKEFPRVGRKAIIINLDMDKLETRDKVKEIAEKYHEILKPFHVSQQLLFREGMALATFDISNTSVVRALEKLSTAVRPEVAARHPDVLKHFDLFGGRNFSVKLVLDQLGTREKVKEIAAMYDELFKYTHVTHELPFIGGIATATFDTSKKNVLEELQKLNNAVRNTPYVSKYFPTGDGEGIIIKLDMDKLETRERLKGIAEEYKESFFAPFCITQELPCTKGTATATFDMNKENVVAQVQKLSGAVLYRNFGTFQATDEWPFRGGKAKATIDTSKRNVVNELNKLNDASRDSGEPFLTVEFPIIGSRKLNMNKLETRKKLKEIAEEYEEYFEPLYVTYELPFSGGRAIAATFDTSKMNVLEDLQKLNETVSNASYVKKEFPRVGRKAIIINLDMDKLETRDKVKDIAEKYHEILKPFHVSQQLLFREGMALATFDISNTSVVRALEKLSTAVRPEVAARHPDVLKHFDLFGGRNFSVKLVLDQLGTREKVKEIAAMYDELHKYTHVTHELPFIGGIATATFDTSKKNVLEELKKLNNAVRNTPYVSKYFPTGDGEGIIIKLDMDKLETRERLKGIAEEYKESFFAPFCITHELPCTKGTATATFDMNKENVVAQVQKLSDAVLYRNYTENTHVTHELPFIGGIATATFDTSKKNVLEELQKLNDAVRNTPYVTKNFPTGDGKGIIIKLDMDKLETRERVKEIAEKYQETFQPSHETHELPFPGGKATANFDIGKMNVLEELQKLNDSARNTSRDIPCVRFTVDGKDIIIKLDMEKLETRETVKKIAEEYKEFLEHELPFPGGKAVASFDISKKNVLEELQKRNDSVSHTSRDIPYVRFTVDGKDIIIKLDMDKLETRERVKQIAEEYKEFLEHELPFAGGVATASFDISKKNVLEELKTLSDSVRNMSRDIPYVRFTVDGKYIIIKLDMDKLETRERVKQIAEEYKESFEFSYETTELPVPGELNNSALNTSRDILCVRFPVDGKYIIIILDMDKLGTCEGVKPIAKELLEHEVPFSGGKATASFDITKKNVLEELQKLNDSVRNTSRDIPYVRFTVDGKYIIIKLDMDKLATRETVKQIAEEYKEFLEHELQFPGGKAIASFDISKKNALEELQKLNDSISNTSRDIPYVMFTVDGKYIIIKLEMDKLETRERVKQMAEEYKEFLEHELPFVGGKATASFDISKKNVLEELQKLSDSIRNTSRDIPYVMFTVDGKDIIIKLEMDKLETRERVKEIAEEYKESFESSYETTELPVPGELNNSALNTSCDILCVRIPVDGKYIIIILDMDKLGTCEGVKPIAKELLEHELPFPGGKATARFDISKKNVLEELQKLSDSVRNTSRDIPYVRFTVDGKDIIIKLDMDKLETRETAKQIAEEYKEFLEHELPFPGGKATASFDISKKNVLEELQKINDSVRNTSRDIPYVRTEFPTVAGKDIIIKLDMDKLETRETVKQIAEEYKEFLEHELPFLGGKATASFDISKKNVLEELQKLSDSVRNTSRDIPYVRFIVDGKDIIIKLDMDKLETREIVKEIAEEYKESFESSYETTELPVLRELNNSALKTSCDILCVRIPVDGKYIIVILDMDKLGTCQGVKPIAKELLEHELPFPGGKATASFDISKKNVLEELKRLNDSVRNTSRDIPYVSFTVDGKYIIIKLDMDKLETRETVKQIAEEYREFLEHELPFPGGKAIASFDISKKNVLKDLQKLNDSVRNMSRDMPYLRIEFSTVAVKDIIIKLDMDKLATRERVKQIAEEYKEFLEHELPFMGGKATTSFDISKKNVLKELQILSDSVCNTSRDIPYVRFTVDGKDIIMKLDMDKLETRETVKQIAEEYKELLEHELPFPGGKATASFDISKKNVLEELKRLNDSVRNTSRDIPYVRFTVDGKYIIIKLDMDKLETRETVKQIAEEYREFLEHELPFPGGKAIATFDISKKNVLKELQKLNDSVRNMSRDMSYVRVEFPTVAVQDIIIKLDMDKLETRERVKQIAEEYKEFLEHELPFKGGKATTSFDISKKNVLKELQILSDSVCNTSRDIPYVRFTVDGKYIIMKLDMDKLETRETVKQIAEEYGEFLEHELQFPGGKAIASFDISKKNALEELQKLNDSIRNTSRDIPYLMFTVDGKDIIIKLEMDKLGTRERVRQIAEEYKEFLEHELPFVGGKATASFDISKKNVLEELQKLSDSIRNTSRDIPYVMFTVGGKDIIIKLDMDKLETRETVKEIAEEFKEYLEHDLPFPGGKVIASFDISKNNVLEELKRLNDSVRNTSRDIPCVRFTVGGKDIIIKLDMDKLETRETVKQIAEEYKEFLEHELPFVGGKATASFDINKKNVLEELQKLNDSIRNTSPDIQYVRFTVERKDIIIKLDMDKLETREAVKQIAEEYKEFLEHELPFPGGNAIASFDISKKNVLEELQKLNDSVRNTSRDMRYVRIEFPTVAGTGIIIKFDMDKLETRERVKQIAEVYKEFLEHELPFAGGKATASFDISKTDVLEELQKLSDSARNTSRDIPYLRFTVDGKYVIIRLDMGKLETRKKVKEISEQYDELLISFHVTHELPFRGGKAIATFDTSNATVMVQLQELSDAVSEAPYVAKEFPTMEGNIVSIRLDMDNKNTRKTLDEIAEKYKEYLDPEPKITKDFDLITMRVPRNDRSFIVITIDKKDPVTIRALKRLTVGQYRPGIKPIEITIDERGNKNVIKVDLTNPLAGRILKAVSIPTVGYADYGPSNKPMTLIVLANNRLRAVTLNTENQDTALEIVKISQSNPPGQSSSAIRMQDSNGQVVLVKIDLNNKAVAENIIKIAENSQADADIDGSVTPFLDFYMPMKTGKHNYVRLHLDRLTVRALSRIKPVRGSGRPLEVGLDATDQYSVQMLKALSDNSKK